MATTVNITATASNGLLHYYDPGASYSTVHNAAVATNIYALIKIGQQKSVGQYIIDRSFLYFDTSAIADDAVIISAKIKLYFSQDFSDTDFNIVIRKNIADTYPSVPLVVADFDYTFYTSDGGSINTADVVAGYNDIWLNSTGRSWIKLTGTTKIALISSRDIDSTIPDGNERMDFDHSTGANKPILTITYAAESYPTATTQAATNVGKTYCTANGTLTGGGLATEWGFEYGLTETPTWIVTQTGSIGEQTFSVGIPGLEPSTTYYYRAYCTNSKGTGYGDWVTFTTGTPSSYGIYEEDNTATICFYVRQIGGKWSIKHGPYTTDQADIEITKILTEGKGRYQIKIESNVLTGISTSVLVKMDIKVRT